MSEQTSKYSEWVDRDMPALTLISSGWDRNMLRSARCPVQVSLVEQLPYEHTLKDFLNMV